jgi:hypothetical protein
VGNYQLSSQIILEPISKNLKVRVQEVIGLAVEAFSEEFKESWKWMSLECARRKLGLF